MNHRASQPTSESSHPLSHPPPGGRQGLGRRVYHQPCSHRPRSHRPRSHRRPSSLHATGPRGGRPTTALGRPAGLGWSLLFAAATAVSLSATFPAVAQAPRPAPKAEGTKIDVHGHRGARALRPENSLAGFAYALQVGVDFLEMDIVVTRDDRLIVAHDLFVNPALCVFRDGTAIPPQRAFREMTLREVQTLDCGNRANPRFPRQERRAGAGVPTLEEVFALVQQSAAPAAARVRFNIEAKRVPGRPSLSPSPAQFVNLLLKTVRRHRLLPRVVLQSFDGRILRAARKAAPSLTLSFLNSDDLPDFVGLARDLDVQIISPHHEWITQDDIAALHARGIEVIPWTANSPRAWDRLIRMGVDGIITDDPAALLSHLRSRGLHR